MHTPETESQLRQEHELTERFTFETPFVCNDGKIKNVAVEGLVGRLTGTNPYKPESVPNCPYYDPSQYQCTNETKDSRCPHVKEYTTYYKIPRYGSMYAL